MDEIDLICLKCIGDPHLRQLLREEASPGRCASCGNRRLATSLEEIAAQIDSAYREHYRPGDDTGFGTTGEDPASIVQEIAKIEPDIAESVVEYLSAQEARDVQKGAEPYYDQDSNYEFIDPHPGELLIAWEEFRTRLLHEQRFFDREAADRLAVIFGDGHSIADPKDLVRVCIAHLKRGEAVFRARRADSRDVLRQIGNDPRQQLAPPAPRLAVAGRMNAAGIPVFYGAFSADVCIAEVRPHVGGTVVVGEFRTTRRLRVLDLTRLNEHGYARSYWDDDFDDRLTRRRFLETFHGLISRPIQPHEETLEYLPTQAVSEYLASVLGLDGIIYDSAQVSPSKEDDNPRRSQNLALFNHAAGVVGGRRRRSRNERIEALVDGDEDIAEPELPRPSLRYVRSSARAVEVTGVSVSHKYRSFPYATPRRRRASLVASPGRGGQKHAPA